VIAGNFTDPATGTIDRTKLSAARSDPQNSEMWVQVEEIIRHELKMDKLILALRTMEHVTDLELETLVRQQYTRMEASFIPVPFSFAGDDSKYPVKEDEIKNTTVSTASFLPRTLPAPPTLSFSLSFPQQKTAWPHSRSLCPSAPDLQQPATTPTL